MKRIIAFLLSILILSSLCACTKKTGGTRTPITDTTVDTSVPSSDNAESTPPGTEQLVGTWVCPLSIETTLAINGQSLETIMEGFTPEQIGCSTTMNVYLDFNADGTATFTQKGVELDAAMLDLYTCFYTYISDYEVASELYDLDKAHLDYNAHEQYEVSTWPEAMQVVIDNMTTQAEENPSGDAVSQINYALDGNTVTLTYTADNTTETYTLDGLTLTCTASDNFTGDVSEFTYTNQVYLGEWRCETDALTVSGVSDMTTQEYFNSLLSTYNITLTDLGVDVPEKLPLYYVLTFDEEGAVNSAEAEEYFAFLGEFYDAFADYISDPEVFASCYYSSMEELETIAANADMTVEEFMADELEYVSSIDDQVKASLDSGTSTASYTIEGNKITVSSSIDSLVYEYKDGKLVTGDDSGELVFKKRARA